MLKFIVPLLIASVVVVSGSSLSKSLTLLEQHDIAKVLRQPPIDLQSMFYSATALTAIDKEVREPHLVCAFVNDHVVKTDAESLMQYSTIVKMLQCKDTPAIDIASLITDHKDPIALAQLITAMGNLGMDVDDALVKKFVDVAKENDSPKVAAAMFTAASVLPADNDAVKGIVGMVEDIVAQADEANDQLQFEGGVSVTADVVASILALGDQRGEKLLKDDQAVKFARYFLSRKYVRELKQVHHLLVGLGGLSKNKHVVPVVVSVFRSSLITTESPTLKLRVTNLIDQSIPDATLTAKSFETADADATAVFENKPLTKSDDTDDFIVIDSEVAKGFIAANAFKLDVMSASPTRGLYNCEVEVGLKEEGSAMFVLDGKFTIPVKVLAKIMVEDVQLGIGDRDSSSVSKMTKLKFPEKVGKVLEADYHQKLVMTFVLKNIEQGNLVTVHQTFVRLLHETTGQEIFFVAEADSQDHYKFTLDVGTTGKDSFNNLSGKYRITLIIGDRAMQVPIAWTLGDVALTFSGEAKKTKRQQRITEPQPKIEHMFRVPEKRPSKLVSTAFTILVVSAVFIMFAMWMKIGVNVGNFRLSLPTIGFHLGLAGIFVLYYMFWVRLDMFVTLKLLMAVGGVTFISGNRMLADMAANRCKTS